MASNTPKIKTFINKILEAEKKRFAKALVKEFQTNFPNDFVSAFARVYDQTLISGGGMKDDPTSPEQIKSEVLATIRSRTEEAVGRLSADGGEIRIKGIAKGELGFMGGGGIPASFKNPPKQFLFAFYIIGMVGDLVFISQETFRKMGLKSGSLGRFGQGFLMSGDKYKKMLARQAHSGSEKKNLPSYEEVLHPFSGKGPINFFGILRKQIDLGKYVSAAVKKMGAK